MDDSQDTYRTATNVSLYLKPWIAAKVNDNSPESTGKVPIALAKKVNSSIQLPQMNLKESRNGRAQKSTVLKKRVMPKHIDV